MNETASTPSPVAQRSPAARQFLGALLGTVVVAAAFGISYFVARGAGEGATAAPPTTSAGILDVPGPEAGAAHPAGEGMTAAQASELAALEAALEESPDDRTVRQQYARALAEAEQFMPAYRQAEELQNRFPGDVEALYVKGLVRMRMGQTTQALADLSQALQAEPDHVDALLAYGLGQLRIGDASGAIASWERGLAAAGGQHGELQRLLNVSRAARAEKQRKSGEPEAASSGLGQWATPQAPRSQGDSTPGR
jgi:tetratricopeptide (TPR) repeat protein